MGDNDRSERLKAMADAIREIKASYYCGSQDAYEYLREKRKYFDLAFDINRKLRVEFSHVQLPNATEIEDVEWQLIGVLYDHFSAKHYGLTWDDLWKQKKDCQPVENDKDAWLSENFTNFALEYYSGILACEDPDHYAKQLVFLKTCTHFFGEFDPVIKDTVQDEVEDIGTDLEDYEATRVSEHFNTRKLYERLRNDHVKNRDEYQRLFIANYLDGLRERYDSTFVITGMETGKFPQTFEELVEVEGRLREHVRKNDAPGKDKEEVLEYYEYLNRTFHRHRSFVEKMLREHNKQGDDAA